MRRIFEVWKFIWTLIYYILLTPCFGMKGLMAGVKYAERYPNRSEEHANKAILRYASYVSYVFMKKIGL